MDIKQALIENTKIRSNIHLDRYVKLIRYYQENICIKCVPPKGEFERHHILPIKIFPEYKKAKWNLVVLPTKAHYLAHYLLFKAISDKSCVYAFNQMRRVSKSNGVVNCRLYEAVRKEFARLISENNTNSKMSDKVKLQLHLKFKGTNVYRNVETTKLQRFLVGKQPNGWEPFQTGRVRTKQSKDKIKKIMSGRIWQYNTNSKKVCFSKNLLDGFTLGYPGWYNGNRGILQDYKWMHDPETNEHCRIKNTLPMPEGYILGRKFKNFGFDMINNSNVFRIIDLATKTFTMINKIDFDPKLHMTAGTSIDDTFIFLYNNKIYLHYVDLLQDCPELPGMRKRNDTINDFIVPKPYHNMTDKRKLFCSLNEGKTMKQIGLVVIKLVDLQYDKEAVYVRHYRD